MEVPVLSDGSGEDQEKIKHNKAHSTSSDVSNENSVSVLGRRATKSPIVFAVQTILVFIVIISAIINLSIKSHDDPNSKLWIMLLSACVGYYLPNPSMKLLPKI
jgi:hypothetical protein